MKVIVSDVCPPGRAYLVDVTSFGLDTETGKLVVFNPEQSDAAQLVEELLAAEERVPDVLRQVAVMEGIADALSTRA